MPYYPGSRGRRNPAPRERHDPGGVPMLNSRFRELRAFRVSLATGAMLLLWSAAYLQPAQAANGAIKQYTSSIVPTTVGAGSTATYTLTLTNVPASPQLLGSVNLSAGASDTTSAHFT